MRAPDDAPADPRASLKPRVPTGSRAHERARSSERLTRSDRVRRRGEFRRAQEAGRRVHTKHFVWVLSRSETDRPRLGITVTKRIGNAVERNRTKRLVREVFRKQRAWFAAGVDVIAIAKAGAPELGYATVRAELASVRRELEKATRSVLGSARSEDTR